MMEYTFEIYWQLRKGLGPDWIDKHETICLDDLPEETSLQEAKDMAIWDFKINRSRSGISKGEYIIKEVNRS